jgi:hypothetical protein
MIDKCRLNVQSLDNHPTGDVVLIQLDTFFISHARAGGHPVLAVASIGIEAWIPAPD